MDKRLAKFGDFFKKFRRSKQTKPTIYVASGIEFAESLDWRDWVKQQLSHKYEVILPDIIPCPYKKGDFEFPGWIYKNFVEPDVTDIVNCDQFFAFIDPSFLLGAGGKAEITIASVLDKPITYFPHNVQLEELNSWVIGCLHNATKVNNFTELVEHYKKL